MITTKARVTHKEMNLSSKYMFRPKARLEYHISKEELKVILTANYKLK